MNEKQLQQMTSKKGFIAALDQSGGSTPKALRLYGIPEDKYSTDDEMFDLVHEMRTRIIKSPSFTGEKIIGAILTLQYYMFYTIFNIPSLYYNFFNYLCYF